MSKLLAKAIKINEYLFPLFVGAAFIASSLETYSYIGFLKKYIFVDSRFFVVLAIFSTILLIGRKLNTFNNFVLKVNLIIFPLVAILYLVMQFLEAIRFPNYTFSTYHIQPTNFFYIVLMSLTLLLISKITKQKSLVSNGSAFKPFLILIFIAAFINGAVKTVDAAIFTNIYVFSHLNASYDYKMTALDRWSNYYDYIKFVKENTPENAFILVPPQQLPWNSTGNVGLDRYFLYPRNLENGSLNEPIDSSKYNYVLIVWGEWYIDDKNAYGWPKVPVKAESIIYFNPGTRKVSEIKGNYNPVKSAENGVWGIIKIKK